MSYPREGQNICLWCNNRDFWKNLEWFFAFHRDGTPFEYYRHKKDVDCPILSIGVAKANNGKYFLDGPWYGQRQEDRKIAELIGVRRYGFYVDVGCWEPTLDSVTKYFYDRGWSGINIDPVEEYIAKTSMERPRDTNLWCGVSDSFEEFILHHFPGTGLSTFRSDYREDYVSSGRPINDTLVQVRTLADILDEFLPPGQEIDFLKIDVEGWEKQVLTGMDFKRYRPKLVVIEATKPGTDIPDWSNWESLILAAGYEFVHFDGLNRFYMDRETKSPS